MIWRHTEITESEARRVSELSPTTLDKGVEVNADTRAAAWSLGVAGPLCLTVVKLDPPMPAAVGWAAAVVFFGILPAVGALASSITELGGWGSLFPTASPTRWMALRLRRGAAVSMPESWRKPIALRIAPIFRRAAEWLDDFAALLEQDG